MPDIRFGEFLPDQQDRKGRSSHALNVYPTIQGYNSFPSLQPLSDALDGRPRGAIFCRSIAGPVRGFVGTRTSLYELDTVTLVNLSKVGGYQGANSDGWEFAQWNIGAKDRVIAANYNDPTQFKELGDNDLFADLPNAPKARHITVLRDFLLLGNVNDVVDGPRGNRIFWSAFRDETGWTPTVDQCDFQDLKGSGGNVQRVFGGEYGVVFQERAIHRLEYVGVPLVFQINEVESGQGTSVSRSCVQFGRRIFYYGRDGFYELVDGSISNPIGAEKIDRYFAKDFDSDYKWTLTATIDPVRNIAIWNYAGAGHVDGVPNKALIYNWETKRWSKAEFDVSLIFHGATLGLTLDELDPFGDIDSLPFSLDSEVWKGGNEFLAGITQDNRFGFFDGAALEAEIDTPEVGGDNRQYTSYVRPYIQGTPASNVTVAIGHRDDLTDAVVYTAFQALDNVGKAPFRVDARYQRIRVRITDNFEHANEVYLEARNSGKR